jgi:hypothetical protein
VKTDSEVYPTAAKHQQLRLGKSQLIDVETANIGLFEALLLKKAL